MRDTLSMGQQDATLEDKMITICYGTDMVPSALSWVNFAANSKDVAQVCANIYMWIFAGCTYYAIPFIKL